MVALGEPIFLSACSYRLKKRVLTAAIVEAKESDLSSDAAKQVVRQSIEVIGAYAAQYPEDLVEDAIAADTELFAIATETGVWAGAGEAERNLAAEEAMAQFEKRRVLGVEDWGPDGPATPMLLAA